MKRVTSADLQIGNGCVLNNGRNAGLETSAPLDSPDDI